MSSIYDWVTTAADNDDADSEINWAEGQPPSSVNNSARAMMMQTAYWRQQLTSQCASAGSSNAYTVTTGQSLASLPAGFRVAFTANHASTGAATLAVDGLTAVNLKKNNDQDIASGDIEVGQIVEVIYDGTSFQVVSDLATGLDSGDIGSSIQAWSADLDTYSSNPLTAAELQQLQNIGTSTISAAQWGYVGAISAYGASLIDDADAATARATLGLGSIATQNANAVAITGGSITGITDLAVADGGTGASTAAGARTNLGLVIGTDVQAYDAALDSIAGLTTSANKMIYTNGASSYVTTDLTVFARSLLDDANASTARTTLGLAIGSDVQAYDAGLASIAGLTTVADRMIYTTASDTYAVTTLTSFGRSLLDDADAATARSTLGLGSIATQAASSVAITGGAINGTAIGGTTPEAGTFTTLTAQSLLVQNGSSGATASTLADDLIVERNTTAGMSFLTPNNAAVYINFSDPDDNDAGRIVYSHNTDRMSLRAGGTDRVDIESGGDISFYDNTGASQDFFWDASTSRLGIGTTSPSSSLDVTTAASNDGIEVTDGTVRTVLYSTLSSRASLFVTTNHDLDIGTNNTSRVRVTAAGNVGIGTASPAQELHVSSTGTTYFRVTGGSATYTGVDLGQTSAGDGLIIQRDNKPLALYTNGTEAMRIDSSGNVGIGTTSPTMALDVVSTGGNIAKFTRDLATDTGIRIDADAAGPQLFTVGAHTIRFYSNVTEKLRIDTNTGSTGGTGSAGAGNQYVELRINGSRYKLLHDGTL